ncbi:MAG: tRNA (guanosine(46)-N7)-methyltransferase TrmB [Proteobacteria bacterium]|nr:tRNA (guanosine(46)-N7)-methyltransferase TrmB [Pseudomonadota bacterium]
MEKRKVRSYVLRAGRMSDGQKNARQQLGGKYLLPLQLKSTLNFNTIFGNNNPTYLEIGFGMGDATVEVAQSYPAHNYIGIEVHPPGVGRLLKLSEDAGLSNLRVIEHDAVEVTRHMFAEKSLSGIHIFFPDPWPKKRHYKRRLINGEFINQMALLLMKTGYLHIATDWEQYAEEILVTLLENHHLENTAVDFCERPSYRPTTKFERRGLKLGHQVWDIIFQKR